MAVPRVQERLLPPDRRRELLVILSGLAAAVVLGAAISAGSSRFGPSQLGFLVVLIIVAGVSATSLRLATLTLVVGLALPFRTLLFFGIELHTNHFVLGLICIIGLVDMALGGRTPPPRFVLPCVVIVLGGVVAAIAGPDFGGSMFRLANGVVLILVAGAVIAANLRPQRDLPWLTLAMAAGLALASMIALLQSIGRMPASIAPELYASRVNALFLHPNILGGYLTAVILLLAGVAAYAWHRLPFAAIVIVPSILLGVGALIVSQSRGALLGLAAGAVVAMVLMTARRKAMAVIAILGISAVGLLAVVPEVPESQRAQFAQRLQTLRQPGAEQGRQRIYHAAEVVIRQHPITGVGVLTFQEVVAQHAPVPGLEFGLRHSHNIFFEAWLSVGLFGVLAFIWLWGDAIRRLIRATRMRDGDDPIIAGWAVGSIAALTSIFAQGLTDMVFWQIEMFVLLIVLIAGAYAIDGAAREPAGG